MLLLEVVALVLLLLLLPPELARPTDTAQGHTLLLFRGGAGVGIEGWLSKAESN